MCFNFFRRSKKTTTTRPLAVSGGKPPCRCGTPMSLPKCRTEQSTLSKSEQKFVDDCIKQSFKKRAIPPGVWKYMKSLTFQGTGTSNLTKGKPSHTLFYSGTCKKSLSPSNQEGERVEDTEQTSPKETKNYMNCLNLSLQSKSPLKLPSPLLRPNP